MKVAQSEGILLERNLETFRWRNKVPYENEVLFNTLKVDRLVVKDMKLWGRKSKEFKVHSLIDKIYKELNLYIAFEKVKANKGSGGVDKVSIESFERDLVQNIKEIHRLLKLDKYQPQPVKRVWIPKSDGDKRPLGIPTIKDRVVQQAILNRLEKIFEPEFCDCSYGFRKGKSGHQAIAKVEEYIRDGCQWIVEVDIEKFFDTLDHEKLIDHVAEEIADGRVLRLIRGILKSGVMEEMKIAHQTSGTPQGGVISPILANIYLNKYDKVMTAEGYRVVRYADDIVVLCKSKDEAEKVLKRTKEIIEGRLNLKLHPDKTRIVQIRQGFEFLGYKFGSGYSIYKIPRDKSIKAFKDKVRFITRRTQPKSMTQIIEELNPIIRGWGNYFLKGNCLWTFHRLDFFLRNRITGFKLKCQGGYGHRKYSFNVLKSMGMLFLKDLLLRVRPELLPAMGQLSRRADCWKSARSVR